ncbi:reverse transcriptase domain-containing protein [Tanacetum coccineum]
MNPRHQPPEQNLEEGTETGIPKAHHRTPVFSKGLRSIDPLHRGPGHGKKEACLIGWAMPTWCHMFNSTLTGNARVWFDKLPKDSIDSYEDPRTAFRENYLQQTKHIKDPVEIHHIKQRDEESMEDFMERYKAESPAVNQVLEEKINIAIHPEYPEQTIAIGSTLTEKGRKELCSLLKQNLDIFAWKPADMTGVPRNIAEHHLNIREHCGTPLEYPGGIFTSQAKEKRTDTGKK